MANIDIIFVEISYAQGRGLFGAVVLAPVYLKLAERFE